MRVRLPICLCFVFVLSMASFTQATVIFGFDQDDLIGLTMQGQYPAGQTLSYIAVNPDPVYGSMSGDVGFIGTLSDYTIPISPKILIGSAALDLTGYDEFAITLFNDNDDLWTVGLYVNTGDSIIYSNELSILPGESASLALDISYLGLVNSMGFTISSNRNDMFHISAHAIPEPATLSLVAMGAVGLLNRYRKQRRA